MNEYGGVTSSVVAAVDYDNLARMVDYQLGRAGVLLEGSGWELKGYNPSQPRGKSSAASNSGSFTSAGGWPGDFPAIKPMTSGEKLKAHPDYEAAKAGDTDAAYNVVRDVIKPDRVLELGRLYPNAKIIPIRAIEATGRNKIPAQFALRIGRLTKLEVESAIVQSNQVHYTGAKAVERFISRAQFEGKVETGRDYIIVDDFVTLGGTISELRQYIESNGGHVVAATALAVGGNARLGTSSNLALQKSTRIALHNHFSHNELHEFLKENEIYNGNINALTNSEGKWLLTFSGLDTLRDRIAQGRDERESRTRRRTVSPGTRGIGETEERAGKETGVKSLAVSPRTDTLIHSGGGIKTLAADPPLHSSIIAAIDYDNMAQMLGYQLGRADALLERSGWELKGYNPNQPRGKSSATSNSGSFISQGGWPKNFPRIKPMTSGKKLKNHPDYEAAKAGNTEAANNVVLDLVKRNRIAELGRLYPHAKVVPVLAQEAAGRNKLPAQFAMLIAELTNLDVEFNIGQSNRAYHTGADAAWRFISRAKFKGEVEEGRDYIIADDFVTMGGTISELRRYIESKGGRVVAATSLAVSGSPRTGYSGDLAQRDATMIALNKKFANNELHELLKENGIYGGNLRSLTNSEGRWLLSFSGIDSLRVRLSDARNEGKHGIGAATVPREIGERERRAKEETGVKSLAVSPITDTLIHYGGGIKTLAEDPPLHSSIIAAIDYDNMAQMLGYQLGRANALLERSGWELKGYNPNQPRGKSSAASNSGSFISQGGWRSDFPTIKPMTSGPALTSHPGHEAAKNGDDQAAAKLVSDLADREKIAELGRLYPKAIVIPVRAGEQEGGNQIPVQLTKVIGELTGNETAFQIVQTNKAGHTGAPAWWRFIKRAKFTGKVEAGRDYIIADDYVTLGGTVSDLRRYIEGQGGRVVAATSLAVASSKHDGSSADLALRKESLIALEDRFTKNGLKELLEEYEIYDGNPKSLTENEAHWLLKFSSLDNVRKRLVDGLREGWSVETQKKRRSKRNKTEQKAFYLEIDEEDALPHLATKLLYVPFSYNQSYGTETFQERWWPQTHPSLARQAEGNEGSRYVDARRGRESQGGDARECQDWRATLSQMVRAGKGIDRTLNESFHAAKRDYIDWDFAKADSRAVGMGYNPERQRDSDFRKAPCENHSGQDERRHSSSLGKEQATVRKEQRLVNDVTDTLIHYGGGIKTLCCRSPSPLINYCRH